MTAGKVTMRRQTKAAEMAERRVKVWDLRVKGMALKAIAKKLGVGYGTVRRDIDFTRRKLETKEERSAQQWRDHALEQFGRIFDLAMRPGEEDLNAAVRSMREIGLIQGLYRVDEGFDGDVDQSVTIEIVEDPPGLGGDADSEPAAVN